MASVTKTSFDATKQYRKVIVQKQKPATDFDINEIMDNLLDLSDRILNTMADGANLLGSAGRVTAYGAAARSVQVKGGLAMHNGTIIRIPDVATLAAFSGGTVSGTVSSLVYVQWQDTEVNYLTDPDIYEVALGESGVRIKRDVQVLVNIGSTTLPAPGGGISTFKLCTVTHNFDLNGTTLLDADCVMEVTGVTPGELSGAGAARTLTVTSAVPVAAGAIGHVVDTKNNLTSGKLVSWRNQGVEKASLAYDGALTVASINGLITTDFARLSVANTFTQNQTISRAAADASLLLASVGGSGKTWSVRSLTTGVLDFYDGTASRASLNASGQLTLTATTGTAPLVVASTTMVTNLDAEFLGATGQNAAFFRNSTNQNAGTLADARLSSNVNLLASAQTITAIKTFRAGAAATTVIETDVTGDAQRRLIIRADGRMTWGTGAAVGDTNLYRGGIDILQTDDSFTVGGTLSVTGGSSFTGAATFSEQAAFLKVGMSPFTVNSAVVVTNLNADRLDGQHGSFYQDATNLTAGTIPDARLSANVDLLNAAQVLTALKTFQGAAVGTVTFGSRVTGDTVSRLTVQADGTLNWGAGGASATDTNLYRSAANTLRTDDAFVVTGVLSSLVSTGTAPLVVASTTLVSNLTVENLGASGQNAAFFRSASNLNAGTVASARISGSYTGITGVGTLAAGSIPASLITAGAFGAGSYSFSAAVTVATNVTATSGDITASDGTLVGIQAAGIPLRLRNSAGAVNVRQWEPRIAADGTLEFRSTTDAGGTVINALQLEFATGHALFAGTVQGTRLISTVSTGTSPLTVASTTLVANLTAENLGASGQNAAFFRNATNLNAGTVADARLSSNVPRKNTANTFTAEQTLSKVSLSVLGVTDGGGSWARGVYFKDHTAATTLGAVGMLGAGATPTSIYLAHGASPHSSTLGIHILANGYVGINKLTPLAPLDVTGDANFSASITVAGGLFVTGGSVSLTGGGSFSGNGSSLTSLNASNLSSGTVATTRLPGTVMYTDSAQTIIGQNIYESTTYWRTAIGEWRLQIANTGILSWAGAGSTSTDTNLYRIGIGELHTDTDFSVGNALTVTGLTTLSGGAAVTGSLTVGGVAVSTVGHVHSGAHITTGTVADARLSANVALLAGAQTFTALKQFAAASAATVVTAHRVNADSFGRLTIQADGKMAWGPGNAATDTTLHRSGVGDLTLTGDLTVTGAVASTGLTGTTASFTGVVTSTIATGTAPFTVASTTLVANLNANYLGAIGQDAAFFRSATNLNAGTIASARVAGSYTGITGVGTLAAGAIPATLITAGTFGAGDYVFPSDLAVTGTLKIGAPAFAGYSASALPGGDAYHIAQVGAVSGEVNWGLAITDGVRNRRAKLFLDDTNNVWGLRQTWGSAGGADFVVSFGNGDAALRLTSAAGNLTVTGTVSTTRLTSTVSTGTAPLVVASTTLVANLTAENLGASGQNAAFFRNATNLNAGTVADARLSANVALLTGTQSFSGAKTFTSQLATSTSALVDFVLKGAPATIRQIQLGDSSAYATIGTRYSGIDLVLATNAYQSTAGTDEWTQPYQNAAFGSWLLRMNANTGQSVQLRWAAPLTASAGTMATVFDTVPFEVTKDGVLTVLSTVQGTRLISTISTGTAPLTVASTTLVTNLNADLLDGQNGSYYTNAANLTGTVASARISGSYTGITGVGTIATGTWNATAISATKGGTAQTSWTLGDTLYSSASNTLAKLAGNTTTTRKFMRQVGNGSVSAAPAWDTLVAGDIPSLAASIITSGVFATARLGGGTANSGTYLRGDGTWAAITTASTTVKKAGTLVGTRSALNLIEGANVTLTTADDAGNDEIDVTVAVTAFPYGSLTGVPSTFAPSAHVHSGADITTGTVADGRLSSNVPRKNAGNVFTAAQTGQRSAGQEVFQAQISGDTQPRWAVTADAILQWGPGNAVADVNLYRSAANVLKTDDAFESASTITGTRLISTIATGTAPLGITSTTLVTNLNADLLDGQQGSYYLAWANLTSKPTTLSGYGITDAVALAGSQTVTGSKTFSAAQTFTAANNMFTGAASTTLTVGARMASDPGYRIGFVADGRVSFGDGGGAEVANLQMVTSGADYMRLTSTGGIQVKATNGGGTLILAAIDNTSGYARWYMDYSGTQFIGDGSGSFDVQIARSAANELTTTVTTAIFSAKVQVNGALEVRGLAWLARDDDGATGTAKTINWANGNNRRVQMTGNCTFTFSNPQAGATLLLEVQQDGVGGRTATWPASVKWAGAGTAPTLSTGANKIDLITFYYNGTNYLGVVSGQNF